MMPISAQSSEQCTQKVLTAIVAETMYRRKKNQAMQLIRKFVDMQLFMYVHIYVLG